MADQEEKRSVMDEINSALPTPRHHTRQELDVQEESGDHAHDPYPQLDEEEEEAPARSVQLEQRELETQDHEGNNMDAAPAPDPDPLASVKETVALISSEIRDDVRNLSHNPNSEVSRRTRSLCQVLRTLQQTADTISRPVTTAASPIQLNPSLPANCRLTVHDVKYLTKLKGKPEEDAGTILKEFHAKAAAKATRNGCTPQQIDEIALQDVEMIMVNDAFQILQQLRTGLIDWEHKGQSSDAAPQKFDPPTTWIDFCQAYLAHTMPANAIELLQKQFQEFQQGPAESIVAYGTRWIQLMSRIESAVKRHYRVKGTNPATPHMIHELMFTERWRSGLRPQIKTRLAERTTDGTFADVRKWARTIESNLNAPQGVATVSTVTTTGSTQPSAGTGYNPTLGYPQTQPAFRSPHPGYQPQRQAYHKPKQSRPPHKSTGSTQHAPGIQKKGGPKRCTYPSCKKRMGHTTEECLIRMRDELRELKKSTSSSIQATGHSTSSSRKSSSRIGKAPRRSPSPEPSDNSGGSDSESA